MQRSRHNHTVSCLRSVKFLLWTALVCALLLPFDQLGTCTAVPSSGSPPLLISILQWNVCSSDSAPYEMQQEHLSAPISPSVGAHPPRLSGEDNTCISVQGPSEHSITTKCSHVQQLDSDSHCHPPHAFTCLKWTPQGARGLAAGRQVPLHHRRPAECPSLGAATGTSGWSTSIGTRMDAWLVCSAFPARASTSPASSPAQPPSTNFSTRA